MPLRYTIRFVKPEDLKALVDLCSDHAAYERSAYVKSGKAARLRSALFGRQKMLDCLVVESGNEVIAYATYMKQYATWEAEEYVYMDCLYIKEFARGLGIGEKLVRRIQEEAKSLGCHLVQWQTPSFNHRAMRFYHRIGAVSKTKERFFLTLAEP